MTRKQDRGFTLVELLVGLGISVIVIAGVFVAFNKINIGVKNASRSNDLTSSARGIFQILKADFSKAGLGFSDLNSLQIHFQHNNRAPNETYFYPIIGMPTKNGSSQVAIQWFDYDLINDPTYMLINPTPDPTLSGNVWPSTLTGFVLATADPTDTQLPNIAVGDIFLLYDPNINFTISVHEQIYDTFDIDGISWDEVTLGNGAMIVQGETIVPDLALGQVDVTLGSTYKFTNALDMPDSLYTSTVNDANLTTSLSTAAIDGMTRFQFRPPVGSWVARKLSNVGGYHRVRYHVENNALVRTDESGASSQDMVLATGVLSMNLEIGIDMDPTVVANQTWEAWDGSVSVDDTGLWFAEASSDEDAIKIGRHAVAVRVTLELESLKDDVFDQSASGGVGSNAGKKTRVFTEQFKIRNAHRPLVNY